MLESSQKHPHQQHQPPSGFSNCFYPLLLDLSSLRKHKYSPWISCKDVMRISKTNCFHCSAIWIKYSPNKLYTKVSPVWRKFSEFLWPNNYKEVKPPTIWLSRKTLWLSFENIFTPWYLKPLRIFNVEKFFVFSQLRRRNKCLVLLPSSCLCKLIKSSK